MKTKINKVPPWTKSKRFTRTSFDDAFSKLGIMSGFINPKEITKKLDSPLVRK